MTFGEALEVLKAGHKVTRTLWNNERLALNLVRPVGLYSFDSPYAWELSPWIGVNDDSNRLVPWQPCQDDMLCEDWYTIYVH